MLISELIEDESLLDRLYFDFTEYWVVMKPRFDRLGGCKARTIRLLF